MKYLLLSVALCLGIMVQASSVTISFSPDNPIVGQPVNFTANNSCASLSLLPGDGSPQIDMNASSIIYTYTTPGNFTPQMGCFGTLQPLNSTTYMNSGGTVPALIIGAGSSAIPTLGEWGLIILGMIIMGVGLVSMRQKKIVVSTVKE